jgi:hypothetical protein
MTFKSDRAFNQCLSNSKEHIKLVKKINIVTILIIVDLALHVSEHIEVTNMLAALIALL